MLLSIMYPKTDLHQLPPELWQFRARSDGISETFKSGFKPTKAAFLESKRSFCTFRMLMFVLFLVMIGLITEQLKPLSRR